MKDISGVLQWGLGDQSTQNSEMGVKGFPDWQLWDPMAGSPSDSGN